MFNKKRFYGLENLRKMFSQTLVVVLVSEFYFFLTNTSKYVFVNNCILIRTGLTCNNYAFIGTVNLSRISLLLDIPLISQ